MTHPQIIDVVASDMCIACGACVYACPANAIKPIFHKYRGAHEVEVRNTAACRGCSARCDSVCPSLRVDLSGLLADQLGSTCDLPRYGPVQRVDLAFAPGHRDNGVSSSGGVVRAFIEHALRSSQPVICLTRVPAGYMPETIVRPEELTRVPGSIYHSVSFVDAIGAIIRLDRPCLLVCTPCQLAGIRMFASTCMPTLTDKIALVVGLICGWTYSHHSLRAFAKYKNISGEISDASYRGEGKVGQLRLHVEGRVYSFERRAFKSDHDRLDYSAAFSRFLNRCRCRVCEDHVNVLADIAVGDAWLARKPSEKVSIVVTRTALGTERLNQLLAEGQLVVEVAGASDIYESQSSDLVEGTQARKLNRFLRRRGIPAPQFVIGPASTAPVLSSQEVLGFTIELILRRIVRNAWYRLYRRLYAIRHGRTSLFRAMRRAAWGPVLLVRRLLWIGNGEK